MTGSIPQKLLRALLVALKTIVFLAAWLACLGLCAITVPQGAPLTSVPLVLLLTAVAVVVHEAGHYLGARHGRMRVLSVLTTFVELVPQRRGFRWRRRRRHVHTLAGYVAAVAPPGTPLRPAMLAFVAGGPAANLAVAAVSGVAAWLLWPTPATGIVLAFAVLNATLGFYNLVPNAAGHPSDGLQLLFWLRGLDERCEALASLRLLRLSIFGTTPDALPAADLAEIERQSSPAPLDAVWYRTKAAQIGGAWEDTPGLIEAAEKQVQEIDPAELAEYRVLIENLLSELAFSEAMRLRDETPLRELAVSPDLAWSAPALQPRLDALRAAARGDAAARDRALDEARRLAENELDASLALSEARIATLLRERFEIALPAAS